MPSLLKRSQSGTRRNQRTEEWACEVKLLHEDKPLELKFHRDILGQGVLDQVCQQVSHLEEKDYFGLLFVNSENQKKWLDLRNPAYKQLKHTTNKTLYFQVKHYPPYPTDNLKQDLSKYLLYCQLKRDLIEGRLYSPSSRDIVQLAACIVQAEFGDFDTIDGFEHRDYLAGVSLCHNQTPKIESLVYEEHSNLKGKSVQQAEAMFLEKAFALDTYGIDPKPVRDRNGNSLFLGLSYKAVVTFHGSKLTHSFPWESINHIRVQDKMLLLEINLSSTDEMTAAMAQFKYKPRVRLPFAPKRHLLGFKCESKAAAVALWAAALEQQLFFTLNKGSEARVVKSNDGFLRRRRNSFRFSGRSQKELLSSSDYFLNLNQTAPPVVRVKRSDSLSSCPTVRRLPSVRRRLSSSSGSSDNSDVSSVSQSRRAHQASQAQAAKRDSSAAATRFATYPGRKRPDIVDDMESTDQIEQIKSLSHKTDPVVAAEADSKVDSKADSKVDSVFDGQPPAATEEEASSQNAASTNGDVVKAYSGAVAEPVTPDAAGDAAIQSTVPEDAQIVEKTESRAVAAANGDAVVKDAEQVQDEVREQKEQREQPGEAAVTAVTNHAVESAPTSPQLESADTDSATPTTEDVATVESDDAPTANLEREVDDDANKSADTAAVKELDEVLEHHEEAEAVEAAAAAAISAVLPANGSKNNNNNNNSWQSEAEHNSTKTPLKNKDNREAPVEVITPVSRTKAALFLAAAFSLLVMAGVVLFYEAQLNSPAMRSLRQHPLVHEFHDRVYAPIRGRLV